LVFTNSVQKLNPLFFCVEKRSLYFRFLFIFLRFHFVSYHSSLFTIRFICFFPAGLFLIFFCLLISLLHSRTTTGKFSAVGVCNSLDYAQKRKIFFFTNI
jgi:hypothetical protein